MSSNSNFICYAGFEWSRSFEFDTCTGDFSLVGCGIDIYIGDLAHLSIGSGITVSGNIAYANLTEEQTAALSAEGLPIETVTEMINQECCGGQFQGPIFDTKTGPTTTIVLVLTDTIGQRLPPLIGKFLIYPEA